jgi:serine/threonine-protein kinase SRPK3
MLEMIASTDHSHKGRCHLVEYYDTFKLAGPQGAHRCLLTEVLGASLDDLRLHACHDLRLPLRLIKAIVRQILLGLDHLHTSCGIIHTGS